MKNLNIGDLVIPVPIIQGGMGIGVSLSGLASAVANNGCVGVIATVGLGVVNTNEVYPRIRELNIDTLRNEIRRARQLTDGVIGVNIMVALTNYSDLVKTSIEEGIDIIFSGAGLPLDLPKYLYDGVKTKIVPIVSSARATKVLFEKWIRNYNYFPDAIIVEGPKAGGHLGFKKEQINNDQYKLEKIFPEIIDVVESYNKISGKSIPVIAAGGIFTGSDINKFVKMGASGVQMGTRFVATHECDATDEFKDVYLKAEKKDMTIVNSPVGLPGSAIKNVFLEEAEKSNKKPKNCPYNCIITCEYKKSEYCIAKALLNAQKGQLDNALLFAGRNAYKVNEIVSVKELVAKLIDEYHDDQS